MRKKINVIEAMDEYLPDVDGVVNCMHNYCLNLKDDCFLTAIVPKNRKDYVDHFPYKVIRSKSIYVPFLKIYYGIPRVDKKFRKKVEEIPADIVHFHSPFNMARFAVSAAKKKGIPVVATFHSNMRPIFKSVVKFGFIAELMVKRLGRLYNKCDEVFVCSPLVEKQLRSYGYRGKVSYLPFGTDFKRCENVEENAEKANEIFGIDSSELVFIYVGRVMPLKRVDFILKSLKTVKDAGVKFRFYVVGKGPATEKLKKLSDKLGFTEEEVIFTGFLPREQFPLLFSRADLLLFPSLYDNFGLVKVEGAAYETAGVFIENSCAGYGVKDGLDGYISKDDTNSFAAKILEAVSDRDKLKAAGKKASETQYVSWADCAKEVLKTLTRIVEERGRKAENDNKE